MPHYLIPHFQYCCEASLADNVVVRECNTASSRRAGKCWMAVRNALKFVQSVRRLQEEAAVIFDHAVCFPGNSS